MRSVVFGLSLLGAAGAAQAEDGTFIIPTIRAEGGTDFAYWDAFERPPGAPTNSNYNYGNPPALAGGVDGDGNPTTMLVDHDDNPATPDIPRTTLIQTGAADAFVTSSGAIYSFAEVVEFEVPYEAAADAVGEVTNVIFQSQTGGIRLNVNSVELVYEKDGLPVTVMPVYKGMDDPQSGAFTERIVCAFQWDLTGLNVRDFKIVFGAPDASMPLWQAQLDVVIGEPFVQELGYLLATRSRPVTRHTKSGVVDKNLPFTKDGRFFFEEDELTLLGEPANGWYMSGWYYDGVVARGLSLPLVFPAQDITVTALFAPGSYAAWREQMFYRVNSTLGTNNDHTNPEVSGPTVDHDEDGLTNAGEYAFAGDPYTADQVRTRPQLELVEVEGVSYLALKYRTNGREPGEGDVVQRVRVAADGGIFRDNEYEPTTTTVKRELQADGSELVTERTLQPLSSFTSIEMDVWWSVGGVEGAPLAPASLEISSEANLAATQVGRVYSVKLQANGGTQPYEWDVVDGDIPPGITLAADGTLSGMATTAGEYTFTARVRDAFLQAETREFNVAVSPFEIVLNGMLPARPVGNPVFVPLTQTGGTGPYVWRLAAGSLPPGITLNSAGALSGTGTEAGQYVFTLEVKDANDLAVEKVFNWTFFDIEILTANPLPLGVVNVPYSVALTQSGATAPVQWQVAAGALPGGLTLSPAGVLKGSPTSVGAFSFVVQLTGNDGYGTSKSFDLNVAATMPVPVIDAVVFTATMVGEEYAYTVTAAHQPTKFVIKGLPKGLKAKFVNGVVVISGRASVAGTYFVEISASNASGTSDVVVAALEVDGIPDDHVGSFTGLAARDDTANAGLGSLVTFTSTTKGAYTVKVKTGTATKSAKGFLKSTAPQVKVNVNGHELELTLDEDTGLFTGTHGAAVVSGWRLVWDKKSKPASSREGFYTVALDLADVDDLGVATIPQGVGFASFSVLSAGTLKVVGKSADGQGLTAATSLGPDGQLAVYVPMYAKKGSMLGTCQVTAAAVPADNAVSGELDWMKPVTKGRIYANAFGPVNLTMEGSYMGTVTKRPVMLGLPETGALAVEFTGAGVEDSATLPDVTGALWTDKFKADFSGATNAGNVKLTIQKAKGTVSGSFTLTETTPPLARKNVKMLGQVVKLSDGEVKAAGYFLLPQVPENGQKANATPILSGAFYITQPAPAP